MNNEEYYFTREDAGDMVDISSSSTPKNRESKKAKFITETSKKENIVSAYGNTLFKNLGTIIKVISFVIAIAIILLSLVIGILLIKIFDSFFIPIALGVIIVGTLIAAFTFFIIYGIGQIVCQNDEILRRLK